MKKILKNKKGFEMSFGMIFSIMAGAVIIFLAIFTVTKLVNTSQSASYSESAQGLANILNPVVNDVTLATRSPDIDFKKETRVYLDCYASDYKSPVFGRQTVSFSQQSGFFNNGGVPGANISRANKYIFSENFIEGKILHIFSKPFYLGYKVDDLVFLAFEDYCFVAPPEFIEQEIESLGIKNINITSQLTQCKKDEISVCFGFAQNCNITVYPDETYESGRVSKSGKTIYFAGSLIYGAIFSSPSIYECNVKRLGIKTNELGKIYKEKIDIVKTKGCNSLIENNLDNIIGLTSNLSSSKLSIVYDEANSMNSKNCGAECQIYSGETC